MTRDGSATVSDTSTYTIDFEYVAKNVGDGRVVYQYVNPLGVNVEITAYGTYAGDDDYSDGVQLDQSTVNSSSTGSFSLTDPWEQVRFEIVAQSSPSSGDVLIKEHNTR